MKCILQLVVQLLIRLVLFVGVDNICHGYESVWIR